MKNELIDMMREFNLEARMLGPLENPDPSSPAIAAMLDEIHRLRTALANTPAPDVSDEGLAEVFSSAVSSHSIAHWLSSPREQTIFGIQAVRQVLASSTVAVDVPELPDAWWTYEITKRDGHLEADIWLADEDETILSGVGASPEEAIVAAIANATSEGGAM